MHQCSNQCKDCFLAQGNEGAHYITIAIKYGTQPEMASTAMLQSQVPMHRVMPALLDANMKLSKQGQPIAQKLNANKTTVIKSNMDYYHYYYKDYAHPLCMPARGKHVATQYQVKNIKELMLKS